MPSPWPVAPDVIVSHDASLAADHVHSRAVDTDTLPVPPPAATALLPVRLMAQREPVGLTTDVDDDPQEPAPNAASVATTNRTNG